MGGGAALGARAAPRSWLWMGTEEKAGRLAVRCGGLRGGRAPGSHSTILLWCLHGSQLLAALLNTHISAGDGRASANGVPKLILARTGRPVVGPKPPAGSWSGTSTPLGSLRQLPYFPLLIYMLIGSGKSSLIGRIRQSKRIVSQSEPN